MMSTAAQLVLDVLHLFYCSLNQHPQFARLLPLCISFGVLCSYFVNNRFHLGIVYVETCPRRVAASLVLLSGSPEVIAELHRLGKVRLSIRAQNHLGQLKYKTGLPINVLARFGLCLSLNDESMPNPDMYDEKGMELMPHVLFGKNELMFAVMIEQRLRTDGLDYGLYADRMTRAHVNRGAGILFPRIGGLEDFARLLGEKPKATTKSDVSRNA